MNLLAFFEFAQGHVDTAGVAIFLVLAASLWMVLGLVERVLFALAAYYDACAKENADALMWALLIGFLGFIPGIIYLFVRNTGTGYAICPNCGLGHSGRDFACPRCGATTPVRDPNANPMAPLQAHRAKVLMIIGFVVIAVMLVLGVIFTIYFINRMLPVATVEFFH